MSKSDIRPDSTQRLLAICGIVGPILYTIVLIIVGFLRPGYNHITQVMSELGEVGGPNAIVMNIAGFTLLGLLMIAFAFGLDRGISEGKGWKVGPALVALAGAGFVVVGFFQCDPGCVIVSSTGVMHVVSAAVSGYAMIFANLIISLRLKNDSRWQGYWLYSVATCILTVVFSFLFNSVVFESWIGALQRIALGIQLLWMEVMAIQLLRLSQ